MSPEPEVASEATEKPWVYLVFPLLNMLSCGDESQEERRRAELEARLGHILVFDELEEAVRTATAFPPESTGQRRTATMQYPEGEPGDTVTAHALTIVANWLGKGYLVRLTLQYRPEHKGGLVIEEKILLRLKRQ